MNLSASNDVKMAFHGCVEEQFWKIPHFKTIMLSLTCLHTNSNKSFSLFFDYIKLTIHYGNYKEIVS